jgi:Rrf2 family protein
MKISTKGRYGVHMMIDLAIHGSRGPVLLKDIARRQHISEKYLGHLVPLLKSAGLISTARGAHGGFTLMKAPGSITLKDIIAAVEGPICLVGCLADHETCIRSGGCAVQNFWGEATRRMVEVFDSFTLKQLADEDVQKQIGSNYDI